MAEDKDPETEVATLRLLVEHTTSRVLYAEGDKTFVGLFFSFLVLPTGTVINLLTSLDKHAREVGCVTNIYNSVNDLKPTYLVNPATKKDLLEPKVAAFLPPNTTLNIEPPPQNTTYYVCNRGSDRHDGSVTQGSMCCCGHRRDTALEIVDERNSTDISSNLQEQVSVVAASCSSGYVKDTVTFIITDDLKISPTSTITSMMLLSRLSIKDISSLEERWVTVGQTETLQLLRAAFVSKTALNYVFGKGKGTTEQRIVDISVDEVTESLSDLK